MSDEARTYTVTATKTVTATFEVDAEDEDDARFAVETPTGFDYEVRCEDAMKLEQDDWDVSDIEAK